MGALIFNKAPIEVPAEYSHYSNIFLVKNIIEFLKYTRMNNHAIKLKKSKVATFWTYLQLRASKAKDFKNLH